MDEQVFALIGNRTLFPLVWNSLKAKTRSKTVLLKEFDLAQALSTSSDWCRRHSKEAAAKAQLEEENAALRLWVHVTDPYSRHSPLGHCKLLFKWVRVKNKPLRLWPHNAMDTYLLVLVSWPSWRINCSQWKRKVAQTPRVSWISFAILVGKMTPPDWKTKGSRYLIIISLYRCCCCCWTIFLKTFLGSVVVIWGDTQRSADRSASNEIFHQKTW